jgi:dTDP-4-amino-4,6-dideoxygalactose transaminase
VTQSQWRYMLSDVSFDAAEEQAVLAVIRSGWLSMGPRTSEFEQQLKAYTGARYALATSNCTTALHLAMLALGIGPGDEVIVPSLSFVATANAVLYVEGKPVFAEIESLQRPLISARDVESRITARTKALVVMHYGGHPCDMDAILEVARRHRLPVVEDAAHAIGSKHRERACGAIGAIGCYSFFANKNLAAGEGGAVVTDDEKMFEQMKLRRSHGMTTLSWDRFKGHAFTYDVVDMGFNFRMPELTAAVAAVQLAKLDANNRRRAEAVRAYRELLPKRLQLPFAAEPAPGAHHLMPVLLPEGVDRLAFMTRLREQGIQSSIHYGPIHQFSHYRKLGEVSLPITEEYARRVVTLPLHARLTADDVSQIAAGVGSALG